MLFGRRSCAALARALGGCAPECGGNFLSAELPRAYSLAEQRGTQFAGLGIAAR